MALVDCELTVNLGWCRYFDSRITATSKLFVIGVYDNNVHHANYIYTVERPVNAAGGWGFTIYVRTHQNGYPDDGTKVRLYMLIAY